MTSSPNKPAVKVFWQPGCTSCLRTKEFMAKIGVEYESINLQNNPEGMAQLAALGARSVPVVSRGNQYTLCQSFNDVIKFLELEMKPPEPLPPAALVEKIALVLNAVSRFTRQFSEDQLGQVFRNRNRTIGSTAFHAARVAEMGLEAAQGIELKYEGFDEIAPAHWKGEDIANQALSIRERLLDWWKEQERKDPTIDFEVPTYYGMRPLHDVLDRTAYHAAQHARQLMLMLETHGIAPDRPLTATDLEGLAVPEAAWG